MLLLPEVDHNTLYLKTTKWRVRTQQMLFAKGICNTKKIYHFTQNTVIYPCIHRSSCKIYDPFMDYLKENSLLLPFDALPFSFTDLMKTSAWQYSACQIRQWTAQCSLSSAKKKKKKPKRILEIHILYLALNLIIRRMMVAEWFYKSLNFDAPSWKMNLYYYWNPWAACIKQGKKLLKRKVDTKICGFSTYSNVWFNMQKSLPVGVQKESWIEKKETGSLKGLTINSKSPQRTRLEDDM